MVGGIAQMGLGMLQAGISAAAANKIPENKKITVGPELRAAYNMSRRRADEGFSNEERQGFQQMLARQSSASKQTLQNVGLAGVGSAAANIMGVDALNQFASQNAQVKRQNFGQFAGLANNVQAVQTEEINRGNTENDAQRAALAGATSSGIGNMFGGLTSAESSLQKQQAADMFSGEGGGGTQFSESPFIGGETPSWFT